MYKVVVISSFHEQGLALLRRDDIELHVVDDFSHESLSRALKDADAVTVRTIPLTPELLDFAPRLRIVSRFGVGTDNIPVDYLSNRGIPVAIAVDSNVTTVAEHTLMMLLALAKRAFEGDRAVREDHFAWRNDHPTSGTRPSCSWATGASGGVWRTCAGPSTCASKCTILICLRRARRVSRWPRIYLRRSGGPTRYRCTFPIHRKPDTLWAGEPLPP